MELELKSGPPAALFALARELAAAAPLYLAFDSKAARGQALVAGAAPASRKAGDVALAPDATVGEAFQAIARKALAQIAANARPAARRARASAVHQLRVGARRLRSALTSFRPALAGEGLEAREGRTQVAEPRLRRGPQPRRLRRRDRAPAELGAATPPRGCGPAKSGGRRPPRRPGAGRRGLRLARFRALMIDAAAWVETGDWRRARRPRPRSSPSPARAETPSAQGRQGAAGTCRPPTTRRCTTCASRPRSCATPPRRASLYGRKRSQRLSCGVKALQEVLGALNDLATAEPLIAGLSLSPDAAFAAGDWSG